MRTMRNGRLPLVLLLIASLPISGGWASASDGPIGVASEAERVVRDLRLSPLGELPVRIVDPNGRPAAGKTAILRRNGIAIAEATSDEEGALLVQGLKGGVYEIEVEGHVQMCRVWLAHLAPPAALDSAFMVLEGPILRGQRPLESLVSRRAFILGALVAAAIAIPLAIDDKDSGS